MIFFSSWIQRAPQPSNLPCLWLVVVVSSAEDSLVSPLRLFLPLSPSPQPASTVILAGTFNANLEENTVEKSKRLEVLIWRFPSHKVFEEIARGEEEVVLPFGALFSSTSQAARATSQLFLISSKAFRCYVFLFCFVINV